MHWKKETCFMNCVSQDTESVLYVRFKFLDHPKEDAVYLFSGSSHLSWLRKGISKEAKFIGSISRVVRWFYEEIQILSIEDS